MAPGLTIWSPVEKGRFGNAERSRGVGRRRLRTEDAGHSRLVSYHLRLRRPTCGLGFRIAVVLAARRAALLTQGDRGTHSLVDHERVRGCFLPIG